MESAPQFIGQAAPGKSSTEISLVRLRVARARGLNTAVEKGVPPTYRSKPWEFLASY